MKLFKSCADGVHRFEGRYDKGEARVMEASGGTARQLEVLMDGARKITYIHDICVRCGKIVDRLDE